MWNKEEIGGLLNQTVDQVRIIIQDWIWFKGFICKLVISIDVNLS